MAWEVYVILALAVIIAIGIAIIIPFLKKKGISPAEIFKRTDDVLCDVDKSVDSLAGAFPEYPALVKIGYILDYCKAAVKVAEQRYLTKEITGEARKKVAMQYVKDILAEEEIPVTPTIEKIIEDSIKGAVGDLPPTTPQLAPEPDEESPAEQQERS